MKHSPKLIETEYMTTIPFDIIHAMLTDERVAAQIKNDIISRLKKQLKLEIEISIDGEFTKIKIIVSCKQDILPAGTDAKKYVAYAKLLNKLTDNAFTSRLATYALSKKSCKILTNKMSDFIRFIREQPIIGDDIGIMVSDNKTSYDIHFYAHEPELIARIKDIDIMSMYRKFRDKIVRQSQMNASRLRRQEEQEMTIGRLRDVGNLEPDLVEQIRSVISSMKPKQVQAAVIKFLSSKGNSGTGQQFAGDFLSSIGKELPYRRDRMRYDKGLTRGGQDESDDMPHGGVEY